VTAPAGAREWWRDAVCYQIYPRSFADSNGDGIGDFSGILSRIPYLARLGVDAVWLSPFYPSALADGGYDVADPRDVDPRIGTLADFDDLVERLHAAGIRVIIDVVPNHTSDQRDWFRAALAAGPGSVERARYIFREGRGPNGDLPPNDWPSHFGPTCWTRVPDGEWYLHLFAPEQPDLDWSNPEVREDALTTLAFWADRGVDGFRIDVAHALVKDLSEPYPVIESFAEDLIPADGSHPLFDRDEVHDIYATWRELFDRYDPPRTAVAESWAPAERRARYASPAGLGQSFNFDLLTAPWDAATWRTVISDNLARAAESGSSSTWVLGNHDVVRPATRYGLPPDTDADSWLMTGGSVPEADLRTGLRRARAGLAVLLALPGSSYLYQGEELGLPEVADLPTAVLQDPIWRRSGGTKKGRDGCRVPLPWTVDGSSFGFGPSGSHLPQPSWFAELSVERQAASPDSTLALTRALLSRRRDLLPTSGEFGWASRTDGLLDFRRGSWRCVANFSARDVPLPPGRVLVATDRLHDGMLPPDTAVWVESPE
jgi:alpha-glucosidase